MRRPSLAAVLAVVLCITGTEQVLAIGYWNIPGTFAQWSGHGFGGGYHAPLVLGPAQHDCRCWDAPVRMPCAPTPYCGCGSYGDYGRTVEAPSSMEGFVPMTAPMQGPMPAAAAPMETRMLEPAPATADSVSLEPEPIVEPAVEPVAEPLRPLFDAPF